MDVVGQVIQGHIARHDLEERTEHAKDDVTMSLVPMMRIAREA